MWVPFLPFFLYLEKNPSLHKTVRRVVRETITIHMNRDHSLTYNFPRSHSCAKKGELGMQLSSGTVYVNERLLL